MFTGLFDLKRPGEYPHMFLGDGPVAGGGLRRGKPPAGRLRNEVSFEDLPEGARAVVVEAYKGLWGL